VRRLQSESAPVSRLGHCRDVTLNRLGAWDGWHHGADLFPCLAFVLLQEIPQRVNEDVVGCRPLVLLGPTNLADPVYDRTFLSCQTNGGPLSAFRDVFFSRAHGA